MPNSGVMNSSKTLRWLTIRLVPALTLFIAAVLKVFYAPQLLITGGLLSNSHFLCCVVFGEITIASVIAFSSDLLSWRVALFTFSILFIISTVSTFIGVSCNCFGNAMPSWVSPIANVINIAVCLAFRPASNSVSRSDLRPLILGATVGVVGVGIAYWRITDSLNSNEVRLLIPANMVGKRWPLDSSVSPPLRMLEEGRWMVFVIRRDCVHCSKLLESYFSDPKLHRSSERTATFIAGSNTWFFKFDLVSTDFDPTGSITWNDEEPLVASPSIFLLQEGDVVEASQGSDSDKLLSKLLPEQN